MTHGKSLSGGLRRLHGAPGLLWVAAGGTYLVGLGVFAYFASVVANFPWEVTVSTTVQSWRTSWLDTVMEVISLPSIFVVAAPTVALTAAVLYVRRWRAEGVFIVGTTVVGRLITLAIKELVERPRPSEDVVQVLQEASSGSFPSGHVVHAMVFFGALAIILTVRGRPGAALRGAQVVAVLALVATGISRIYLGAHWLGDVVGGYAFGAVVVAVAVWLWGQWASRRSQE